MSESPRREQKKADDGITTVAKALAPQMGSDPTHLSKGEIDDRKYAVLSELTQAAEGHFYYRAKVDKIRYFQLQLEWDLVSSMSIAGLNRRQNIQMVAAAAGVGRGVMDVAERPNVLSRNISNRNWKEKAAREGKVVQE